MDFILKVLEITSRYDCTDMIWWRCDGEYTPVTFFVNCNDTFAWACSDCEKITPENIQMFEDTLREVESIIDSTAYAGELFVARVRKMRPQGASYKECYDKRLWHLFDSCGPARPSDKEPFGNPVDRDKLDVS